MLRRLILVGLVMCLMLLAGCSDGDRDVGQATPDAGKDVGPDRSVLEGGDTFADTTNDLRTTADQMGNPDCNDKGCDKEGETFEYGGTTWTCVDGQWVDEDGNPDDKDDKPECSNSTHDGYRTVVSGAASREYILHVPASYDGTTPIPLVINFHGFGGCAEDYAETIGELHGLNGTAEKENFLVAYPQAALREKGDVYWEPGDHGGEDILANDVFFTRQLIADIKEELNVDLSRVYATGYSNGGMMAYDLACSARDSIAAAGIMSGIMLSDGCGQPGFTSIIHFHGIADDVIPHDGSGDFPSVASVVGIWLDHNNIPASSLVTTEFDGGNVIRDVYTGGSEDTSFELYTVYIEHEKDGGHVWFSGDIGGASPNQILWGFLSAHSLDD